MELQALRAALRGISAFREVMGAPVPVHAAGLLDALQKGQGERALDCYTALFSALRAGGFQGIGDWLWDALRYTETPFARLAERGIPVEEGPCSPNPGVRFIMVRDPSGIKIEVLEHSRA